MLEFPNNIRLSASCMLIAHIQAITVVAPKNVYTNFHQHSVSLAAGSKECIMCMEYKDIVKLVLIFPLVAAHQYRNASLYPN
jgi:predicted dinucleotide-utilizing enzyme